MVIVDEKWIHYTNSKKMMLWGLSFHAPTSTANSIIKILYGDPFGVLYYEMFKSNETITGPLS